MSTFNSIFFLVRDHCQQNKGHGSARFEKIAGDAGVSTEKLDFYLGCLSEIGVIRYSAAEKKIALTEKGTKVKRIFPNQV